MKAYVLHGIGDLRYEDVELPALEEKTVLVQVRAVGICGSDIPRVYRTGTYSFPMIPGHEF
ncbi:MAG: alcohol dehydrogenase catalytic domain-containing protein, partial [Acetatifactor sp.]|nr:alcohol dehydrogenase catalytic domain-containing protein [Acetatifactor sp.]